MAPDAVSKDTVVDSRLRRLFTGTKEQVKDWLAEHPQDRTSKVRIGNSARFVSVEDYLAD